MYFEEEEVDRSMYSFAMVPELAIRALSRARQSRTMRTYNVVAKFYNISSYTTGRGDLGRPFPAYSTIAIRAGISQSTAIRDIEILSKIYAEDGNALLIKHPRQRKYNSLEKLSNEYELPHFEICVKNNKNIYYEWKNAELRY